MIKKIKKLSIVIILLMLVFMLKGTYVFAETSAQYFEQFKKLPNNKTYNLYLGENMDYIDSNLYFGVQYNGDASIDVKVENKNILQVTENDNRLHAKKVGKSKVTLTMKYGNDTASKSFTVDVKQTSSNKDLDSKENDVLTIVTSAENKTEVLLKNGELWRVDNNTGKLSKKVSGNVADYMFSSVYYREVKGEYSNPETIQKLKKSNTLYVKNGKKRNKNK